MKTRNAISIAVITLFCGFIIGMKFNVSLTDQSDEAKQKLVIGEYALRLREDATILQLIKQNRLECAQKHLEMNVKASIDAADSFRAAPIAKEIDMLEKSVSFGKEQLRVPRLLKEDDPRTCG